MWFVGLKILGQKITYITYIAETDAQTLFNACSSRRFSIIDFIFKFFA